MTLEHGNFDPSEKLNFFVDDTNVNDINNRYTFESKSITGEVESGSTPAKEYKWTGNALTEAFDKNGNVDINIIKEYIRSGKSLFSGVSLKLDDDIKLLSNVEKLRYLSPEYFL